MILVRLVSASSTADPKALANKTWKLPDTRKCSEPAQRPKGQSYAATGARLPRASYGHTSIRLATLAAWGSNAPPVRTRMASKRRAGRLSVDHNACPDRNRIRGGLRNPGHIRAVRYHDPAA